MKQRTRFDPGAVGWRIGKAHELRFTPDRGGISYKE